MCRAHDVWQRCRPTSFRRQEWEACGYWGRKTTSWGTEVSLKGSSPNGTRLRPASQHCVRCKYWVNIDPEWPPVTVRAFFERDDLRERFGRSHSDYGSLSFYFLMQLCWLYVCFSIFFRDGVRVWTLWAAERFRSSCTCYESRVCEPSGSIATRPTLLFIADVTCSSLNWSTYVKSGSGWRTNRPAATSGFHAESVMGSGESMTTMWPIQHGGGGRFDQFAAFQLFANKTVEFLGEMPFGAPHQPDDHQDDGNRH